MEDQLETLTRCTVCASLPPMRLGNVGHNIFVEQRRLFELYRHRDLHDMEALQCEVGRAPENDPDIDTHTDVDATHKQHKQEQTLATLTLISDNAFSQNKNNNLWQK